MEQQKEFLDSHNLVSLNQLPKLDDIIELSDQEKIQLGLLDLTQNEENNSNTESHDQEEFKNENIH